MSFFEQFFQRYEALKERIHNFRIPLSPRGQNIMKVVYFTVPIVGGIYLMNWVNSKSNEKWSKIIEEKEQSMRESASKDIGYNNSDKSA